MREFFVDDLLVRIHFIIVMIRGTGLAPWEFKSPFSGSLTSTFLKQDGTPLTRSNGGVPQVCSVIELANPSPGYLAHKKQHPPLGAP